MPVFGVPKTRGMAAMNLWTFLSLCVVCGMVSRIMAAKVKRKESRGYGHEDTRLIQEIHRGLLRMEERVDALETLLMDRRAKERSYEGFE